MKTGIHPEYTKTLVRCMCGNEFETRSTAGDTITVDLCSSVIRSIRASSA